MSSDSEFSAETVQIKAKGLEYMNNITKAWIPIKEVISKEGDNSADDYIAYTFFIKNDGKENVSYKTKIVIESVIKNVDEAVRVAVYFNGKESVYAKKAKDGSPEPQTIPFISNHLLCSKIEMILNLVKSIDIRLLYGLKEMIQNVLMI